MFFRPKGVSNTSAPIASNRPGAERNPVTTMHQSVGQAPVIPPRSIPPLSPSAQLIVPSRPGVDPRNALSESSSKPQIPPRGRKSPQHDSFSESTPPPRPPKSTPAPPVPTRVPSTLPLSHQPPLPMESSNSDANIALLMELGYSYNDVTRALKIANNNPAVAVQILQSFVTTSTWLLPNKLLLLLRCSLRFQVFAFFFVLLRLNFVFSLYCFKFFCFFPIMNWLEVMYTINDKIFVIIVPFFAAFLNKYFTTTN